MAVIITHVERQDLATYCGRKDTSLESFSPSVVPLALEIGVWAEGTKDTGRLCLSCVRAYNAEMRKGLC